MLVKLRFHLPRHYHLVYFSEGVHDSLEGQRAASISVLHTIPHLFIRLGHWDTPLCIVDLHAI